MDVTTRSLAIADPQRDLRLEIRLWEKIPEDPIVVRQSSYMKGTTAVLPDFLHSIQRYLDWGRKRENEITTQNIEVRLIASQSQGAFRWTSIRLKWKSSWLNLHVRKRQSLSSSTLSLFSFIVCLLALRSLVLEGRERGSPMFTRAAPDKKNTVIVRSLYILLLTNYHAMLCEKRNFTS